MGVVYVGCAVRIVDSGYWVWCMGCHVCIVGEGDYVSQKLSGKCRVLNINQLLYDNNFMA